MSKHRVAVLQVVSTRMSVTAAAATYGIRRQHLQRLLRRYRDGGLEALAPRSRRPRTNPARTSDEVRERIVSLRTELTARGLDAGPVTIAWHLGREGLTIPSSSTVRRILHAAGLVVPQPRKRPRSSWIRFEAAAPNELWQSDFTHWRLADGTQVEIIERLDDPSRLSGVPSDRVTPRSIHQLSPMSRLMCRTCRDSRQWWAVRDSNPRHPRCKRENGRAGRWR